MHRYLNLFFVNIFFNFFTQFSYSLGKNYLSSYTIFPGCLFAFISNIFLNAVFLENTFSTGRNFYNILIVDPKSTSLYVGAHGYVFRLWLYNINDTSSSNLVFFLDFL